MILTLVGYGTPVVLAYALFVGIARQLSPFSRPLEESRRSAWSLALCVSTLTWILLATAMAVLYNRADSTANFALMPSVYIATSVLTAAVAWYWLFGRNVQKNVAYGITLDKARHVVHSDSELTDYGQSASPTPPPDNVRPAYLLNAKTGKLELDELDDAAVNDSSKQAIQNNPVDEEAVVTADVIPEDSTTEQKEGEHCKNDAISLDDRYSAEQLRRKAAETQVLLLRKSLIHAKQETRRANAARAKALGTANKAIAFARQTIQIREQLENELLLARQTLENRHIRVANLAKTMRGGHKSYYPNAFEENLKPFTTDTELSEHPGSSVRMRHKDSG